MSHSKYCVGNGTTVIVVWIGHGRKNSVNWWLSVWAVASKCEFLWSGHQHGRLNWIVSSAIWNKCMNVMNEGAVVLNGTSRDRHSVGTRVVDMSWRGRRGGRSWATDR